MRRHHSPSTTCASFSFFQRSSTVLFLGLFSVWAVCSVMYAYLLSTLFNRTKPATIVSYLILILSVVSSMVMYVSLCGDSAWDCGTHLLLARILSVQQPVVVGCE